MQMKHLTSLQRVYQAHPQTKLINPYLMVDFFNYRLTLRELRLFELGNPDLMRAVGEPRPLNGCYFDTECFRLFVCILLLDKENNIHFLYNIGTSHFKLSNIEIAYGAALTGRLHLLEHLRSQLTSKDIQNIVTSSKVVKSCISSGNAIVLKKLLNFEISPKKTTKDVLNDSHFHTMYYDACTNGNKAIVETLNNVLGAKALRNLFVKENFIYYSQACTSGNNELINILNYILGVDAIDALKACSYMAYRVACSSGNIELVKAFNAKLGVSAVEVIKVRDFEAYIGACSSGNEELVELLNEILGVDAISAIAIKKHEAYKSACRSGNKKLVALLNDKLGEDSVTVLKAEGFLAYRYACHSGDIELVKLLNSRLDVDAINAIKAENYSVYVSACTDGNKDLIDLFNTLLGQNSVKAIQANQYKAYAQACYSGNPALVETLNGILDKDAINAIKRNGCNVYVWACSTRNVELIRVLNGVLGTDSINAIRNDHYRIYKYACSDGNIELVELFNNILGIEALSAIIDDQYTAYAEACSSGNKKLVELLNSKLGAFTSSAIAASDYQAFNQAFNQIHVDVITLLLQDVECFAYAESHYRKDVSGFVNSWVNRSLGWLQNLKSNYLERHPNELFDVNSSKAEHLFYVIRNLIRRGVDREDAKAERLTAQLLFLLDIPSVRNLCHQSKRGVAPNELLRLAQDLGNEDAVQALMNIPAVSEQERNRLSTQEEYNNPITLEVLIRSPSTPDLNRFFSPVKPVHTQQQIDQSLSQTVSSQ